MRLLKCNIILSIHLKKLYLIGDSIRMGYAPYVLRIYSRLKFLYPSAKQIFATSTPVREELFLVLFYKTYGFI